MKDSKIVVGLDIGTTKICAIVGEPAENGKINILGMGKTESKDAVLRGVVVNIDRTVEAIRQAVDEASRVSNVDIGVVYVGIAGQHIKSHHSSTQIMRDNSQDEIRQDDLRRLEENIMKTVVEPGEKILHAIPQDYTVDSERGVKTPVGMAGVKLEGNFHIITAQLAAIRNIERCVSKAKLEIADIILEPIASSESVLTEEEKEAGVALVDIGGGTTDIAIFQDGIIRHTAVIPLGGEIITNDIKEGCNVLLKWAEKMKLQFGSALPDMAKESEVVSIPGLKGKEPREVSLKNLAYIINARVEEIFEHVYFEIKSSGFEKKLQGGIVLTGGGAQLKHLPQFVEYITGLDARVGLPVEHLSKGMIQEVKHPMYATGIGLILCGLNDANDSDSNTMKSTEEKAKKFDIFRNFKQWLADNQNDFEK